MTVANTTHLDRTLRPDLAGRGDRVSRPGPAGLQLAWTFSGPATAEGRRREGRLWAEVTIAGATARCSVWTDSDLGRADVLRDAAGSARVERVGGHLHLHVALAATQDEAGRSAAHELSAVFDGERLLYLATRVPALAGFAGGTYDLTEVVVDFRAEPPAQ